jgi:hypothetical protein
MSQFAVKDFRNVPGVLREKKIAGAKEFARRVGFVMAQEATKEIGIRFQVVPRERRRHPGTRRASQSAMSYNLAEIKAAQDFPIEVDYRVLGGPKVVTRIKVLNNGPKTKQYIIESTDKTGREPWELKGVGAVNRMGGLNQTRNRINPGFLAWPNKSGRFFVTKKPVMWKAGPAQSKTGFLEVARDRAIQMVRGEFR